MQAQNKVKQDGFRVGDVVWDTAYGKGKVVFLDDDAKPVKVVYDSSSYYWYTRDGKLSPEMNRTLFFSEPKIEASVTRPFVPTLVGKRVVVRQKGCYDVVLNITFETQDVFGDDEGIFYKSLVEVYEVSLENLLKP